MAIPFEYEGETYYFLPEEIDNETLELGGRWTRLHEDSVFAETPQAKEATKKEKETVQTELLALVHKHTRPQLHVVSK